MDEVAVDAVADAVRAAGSAVTTVERPDRPTQCSSGRPRRSKLSVRPAALLPRIAVDSGATLTVINFDETAVDDAADTLFRQDVTAVLPALSAKL